jgi:four helix bundle protein
MEQGAKNYRELRVWQSARSLKKDLYRLLDTDKFRGEPRLRDQLREAAASAVSHISEGYARFEPADQARFYRIAKASLVECQNHLVDAMDRGLISDPIRRRFDDRILTIVKPLSALIAYLQSPEAKKNAERIKRQRAARRNGFRTANLEPGTGTRNRNPEHPNIERHDSGDAGDG